MRPSVIAAVFPIIFLGELPDKTMFASLVLSARGRPAAVWLGAMSAFLVHVIIAVTAGVVLFHLVPHRPLQLVVGALFLVGAGYSWHIRNGEEEDGLEVGAAGSVARTAVTAAGVIFLAEWGDLTQVLTANLAARYHSPLSVGLGALLALAVVAAIAVVGGTGLLKVVSVRTLRIATTVVLIVLGAYTLAGAA